MRYSRIGLWAVAAAVAVGVTTTVVATATGAAGREVLSEDGVAGALAQVVGDRERDQPRLEEEVGRVVLDRVDVRAPVEDLALADEARAGADDRARRGRRAPARAARRRWRRRRESAAASTGCFDAVDDVARRQAFGQRVARRDAEAVCDRGDAVAGDDAVAHAQRADRVGDEVLGSFFGRDVDEVEAGFDDVMERAADVVGVEAAVRGAGNAHVASADAWNRP